MADLSTVYGNMYAGPQQVLRYPPVQQQPQPMVEQQAPVSVPPPAPLHHQKDERPSNRELIMMLAIAVLAIVIIDALLRKKTDGPV